VCRFPGVGRALEGPNERRRAACLPVVACGTEDNCPHGGWCSAAALGAYARRLPSSLEDLRGPAAGEVELPLHVAWSGRRVYDVGQEDQRLVLYALLLAEAQREDLERLVHRESLISMWPRLRRLLGPHARREWERQLITPAPR
jgi:hypothetical protein